MPDAIAGETTAAPTDEQLVAAALRGDVSAFGTLVERHWKMVVALARSRIQDAAEAEDVAQESFLKAYRQLRSLREPSRFAGWLSQIALQQTANALRKRRRDKLSADPQEDWEAIPAYTSNPGLTENQALAVQQAVGQLPDKLRRLVVMRFVAGLSATEIGVQLGQRPGTVRIWLHRAYKILRHQLAPLLEETKL